MSMFTNMNQTASKFMPSSDIATIATLGMEVAIVSSLFKLGTMDSSTPAQREEAQAQADQAKAAAMLDDARIKEAQADEDRRRSYYANQGPSF
jgi:hypothetical protein